MFRPRKPTKDIILTVVFEVSIEVVALSEIGVTFAVGEDLAFSVERECTNDMAQPSADTRYRMTMTDFGVSFKGAETCSQGLPELINEAQIGLVRIEDFVLNVVRLRYLMKTILEEPDSGR